MDIRHGICSSCNAHFKVPATFTADKARCKKCGGVVEIGPVVPAGTPPPEGAGGGEAARSQPVPARKPAAPARPARPVAKPAPEPAPEPAREPGPEDDEDGEEAPRRRPGARTSGRRTGGAARRRSTRGTGRGARSKDADESDDAGPGTMLHVGAKRASASSSRARSGSRGGSGTRSGSGSRRRSSSSRKQEKSKSPIIAGVGGLIVVAVLGWFLFGGKSDGGSADEVSAAEGAGDTTPAEPVPAEEPEVADEQVEEPAAEEVAADEPDEPAKPKTKDPSEIDLDAIPDFGPAPETDEETWAQMNEWMAAFMDPDSGIRGTRGRDSLQELGRQAIPVVINSMKRQDYSTEDGMRNGDVAQKLLREICNGSNFDWKYETGPNEQWFNRKVVDFWAKSWSQAESNLDAWFKLGKVPPEKQAEVRDEIGAAIQSAADRAAEENPFDNLDVDD